MNQCSLITITSSRAMEQRGNKMIEKLKEHDVIDPKTDKVIGKIGCDLREIMDKLNELVDAINTIQKEREAERFEIQEWIGILEAVRKSVNVHEKQIDKLQMKVEPEKCETRSENVQDRMIGCTTLDIPKSYKNDQLTLATLDYSKKLEKENSDLKDELERTRKALEIALGAINRTKDWYPTAKIMKEALDKITALEQKD